MRKMKIVADSSANLVKLQSADFASAPMKIITSDKEFVDPHELDEDAVNDYFLDNFKGDCLLAVSDEELIKIRYHTNEPWKVLEYCASLGEIFDIVVEDMDRQARGQKG